MTKTRKITSLMREEKQQQAKNNIIIYGHLLGGKSVVATSLFALLASLTLLLSSHGLNLVKCDQEGIRFESQVSRKSQANAPAAFHHQLEASKSNQIHENPNRKQNLNLNEGAFKRIVDRIESNGRGAEVEKSQSGISTTGENPSSNGRSSHGSFGFTRNSPKSAAAAVAVSEAVEPGSLSTGASKVVSLKEHQFAPVESPQSSSSPRLTFPTKTSTSLSTTTTSTFPSQPSSSSMVASIALKRAATSNDRQVGSLSSPSSPTVTTTQASPSLVSLAAENGQQQQTNSGRDFKSNPMQAMESKIADAKIKLSPNDMTMAAGHHHGKKSYGKYYMFTEVPKKHSYKMGFKRGNHKHMIERKESKHKSHVHSYFKWHDKKGKGSHKFEFKHEHKKKKHY